MMYLQRQSVNKNVLIKVDCYCNLFSDGLPICHHQKLVVPVLNAKPCLKLPSTDSSDNSNCSSFKCLINTTHFDLKIFSGACTESVIYLQHQILESLLIIKHSVDYLLQCSDPALVNAQRQHMQGLRLQECGDQTLVYT